MLYLPSLATVRGSANAKQWAITTHGRLFVPSGNHLYHGDKVEAERVDIENVSQTSKLIKRICYNQELIIGIDPFEN